MRRGWRWATTSVATRSMSAEDAHHSTIYPPRPRRSRHQLPHSRLHVAPLRRASCRPLGRWRPDEARQSAALCRRHHRAVHEGHSRLCVGSMAGSRFTGPTARSSPERPDMPPPGDVWTEQAAVAVASIPVWDGTPFDVVWASDVLYERRSASHARDENKKMTKKAVGAVETVLSFPRSLWARCPSENLPGKASTAPQLPRPLGWPRTKSAVRSSREMSRNQESKMTRAFFHSRVERRYPASCM